MGRDGIEEYGFVGEAEAGEAKVLWTFDMCADKAVGSRPSDACNGAPLIDGNLLGSPRK
jgi:hypothetical protein